MSPPSSSFFGNRLSGFNSEDAIICALCMLRQNHAEPWAGRQSDMIQTSNFTRKITTHKRARTLQNHRNPLVETTKQNSQQLGHSRVLLHLCEWKCHNEFVCQQFWASLGDEFASFFFFTSPLRISSHLFDDLCSNWKLKPETQTTCEHVLPIHHVNLVKRDFLLINIPPYMIECVRAHYGPARALAVCSEKLSWCESFFFSY